MKVMLLTAPGHTPYMPPLALETLAACLRADGREVKCLDVSIDFLHYLLSPERLKIVDATQPRGGREVPWALVQQHDYNLDRSAPNAYTRKFHRRGAIIPQMANDIKVESDSLLLDSITTKVT